MSDATWVCRHGCTYTGDAVAHNMTAHREEYDKVRAVTDRVVLTVWRNEWWWYRVSPAGIMLSRGAEGHASNDVARGEAARLNGKPFLLEVYR